MFRRFRQLRISLAAKCQILFGAAALLIIAAPLAVPWHRMDELMRKADETSARILSDKVISDHLYQELQRQQAIELAAATRSSSQPVSPLIRPISRAPWIEQFDLKPLRLIANTPNSAELTRFERRASSYFRENPAAEFFAEPYSIASGHTRYRYARPLTAAQDCAACHRPPTPLSGQTTPALGLVSIDMDSQVDENQVYLNRLFILVAGLLAGTLAILSLYLIITRLILLPVRVLQETAEKVSQGDLNIRSDISTGDEFEQLSGTFNVMLTNLQMSADQLRGMNKNLDLRLGQLAESNVALFESNRLKSEFLANVSHELRTPLNSILGFAELLKDVGSTAIDTKQARYVQNILTSGKNLLELINDLLDLAKIEAGKMDVRSEPLSLPDLFEGLANILKPLVEQKDLTLATSVHSSVPIVLTDAAKLQQVLYNFLSNAIKFSPPSGRIALSAVLEGSKLVRISVADQGPGIEPDKHELIFEKFRQLDGGVTRQYSGTGLGLAIARELMILLNGNIGVISTPGAGATFWITLPLAVQAGSRDVRSRLILS